MSNHISLSHKYLANWVNPASWNSLQDSRTWQRIHQSSKRVSCQLKATFELFRASGCVSLLLLLRESKKTRVTLFELEMTSPFEFLYHQCLLMDDKVWINTHLYFYTCKYHNWHNALARPLLKPQTIQLNVQPQIVSSPNPDSDLPLNPGKMVPTIITHTDLCLHLSLWW